jgi:hypothetical protein
VSIAFSPSKIRYWLLIMSRVAFKHASKHASRQGSQSTNAQFPQRSFTARFIGIRPAALITPPLDKTGAGVLRPVVGMARPGPSEGRALRPLEGDLEGDSAHGQSHDSWR